jgi:copper chaperone CopZ
VVAYSYFHHTLLDWIIDRMNQQIDQGPMEDIPAWLATAQYPQQALISIGATRYTPYGETHFLQAGDQSIVVVYDGKKFTPEQIKQRVQDSDLDHPSISALVQNVA